VFRQLARIKLVPNRDELGSMHEGGLNMAVAQPDGSTKIYRKLVSLRIGRRLAGLPVMGESRIVAHLGEDGRLAGLVYQWPDVGRPQPLAPEELRSAAELQADAEATLTDGAVGAERIVVVRAELVMYDDDRGVFEPTYHVEARLHYSRPAAAGGDQKDARYDVPFDFFVPVAKRPLAFLPSWRWLRGAHRRQRASQLCAKTSRRLALPISSLGSALAGCGPADPSLSPPIVGKPLYDSQTGLRAS
jgi:hypothetical protein